jgi:hypothetical protein
MTDVREVVLDTMRTSGLAGYESRATPVIDALVDRERGIVEDLVTFARQQGLSEERARTALTEAGLSARPVAVDNGRDWSAAVDTMQDSINQLQGQLDALRRGR